MPHPTGSTPFGTRVSRSDGTGSGVVVNTTEAARQQDMLEVVWDGNDMNAPEMENVTDLLLFGLDKNDILRLAREEAMSLEGVKSVEMALSQDGKVRGVVFERTTGIEFDVKQTDDGRWNVNDDMGRDYTEDTLAYALERAILANP